MTPKCIKPARTSNLISAWSYTSGVDSRSGLTHSAVVTAVNVHNKHPLPDLLHGQERRVHGDSADASKKKLIEGKAPNAKDFTNQRTRRNGVVNEARGPQNRPIRAAIGIKSETLARNFTIIIPGARLACAYSAWP